MYKAIDIYLQRSLHITLIFMVFVTFDRLSHVPSSSWVIFLGCAVYAGFDSGSVLRRNQLLFFGTIFGLICAMILARFVYLEYEITSGALVIVTAAVLFFTAIPYHRLVILVTILSDLLMQRIDSQIVSIKYYSINRFMCLVIVFSICVVLEYFWFGRSNATYLHYLEMRDSLRQDILEFSTLWQQDKLTKCDIYRKIQTVTLKINRINALMSSLTYEKAFSSDISEKDMAYNDRLINSFRMITGLYYMKIHRLEEISESFLAQKIAQIMEKI